ncbi:MAG: hypothetical protein OXG79_12515 [Chloroflexi bacterium]|nr:hypothetical protein [Chloroflexota bacterium]
MAKRELYDLEIREWSGVGAPAHKPAKAAIMKRRDKQPTPKAGEPIQKELADLLTGETDGHQHGVIVSKYGNGKMNIWVTHAMGTDDDTTHSHAIGRDIDGKFKLAMVAGHTHTIDQAALTQAMLALTKGQDPMADDGTQGGGDGGDDKLQKQVDRLTKILGLNADERAHFDKLEDDTDAQDAFLEKSADDRQAEIKEVQKAAEDADPVVYTTAKGVQLRKSAGELAISQAREIDEQASKLAKYEAEREQAAFEKRAETELSHLTGDVKSRAALLRSVESIEDKDQRNTALEALKSSNAEMAKAFETRGVGSDASPGSPEDKLDKMAKGIQERDGGTYHGAYAKAVESPEGSKLYDQTLTQTVEQKES